MNFEMFASRTLLTDYLNEYMDSIENLQKSRKDINRISDISYYPYLNDILYGHFIHDGKDSDEAYELSSKKTIIEKLNGVIRNEPYTEEELNHICCYDTIGKERAFLDIAIKRYFHLLYGTNNVDEIIDEFKKEVTQCGLEISQYDSIIQVLKKEFETKKDIVNIINKKFDERFIKEFNCGGYALEVFDWVSCESGDHDNTVSKILTNPSVRLVGETLLKEDEYLVVFDATSYHFIKQKDGKFFEKMRWTSN